MLTSEDPIIEIDVDTEGFWLILTHFHFLHFEVNGYGYDLECPETTLRLKRLKNYRIAVLVYVSGPIVIATGLLLLICGVVWIPVAHTKKKISIRKMKVEYRQLGVLSS